MWSHDLIHQERHIPLRPGTAASGTEHNTNIVWFARPHMRDFPRSLVEFQSRFPGEAACVAYLFAARWPHGFVCPACGTNKAWRPQTKAWVGECAGCGRQTSVTAGDHAPLQAAADHVVLGSLSDGDPFKRHLGAATAAPACFGLVQIGLADGHQAAPQHGGRRTAARSPAWSKSTRPRSSAAARTIP